MKKKIIAATMAAAMCVSLAACGGSTASSSAAESTASSTAESTASSTADAASTGDEEVDLRMAWWGSQDRHDRTIKAIELYESLHPNVKIEYEYYSFDDYFTKLKTLVASDQVWDIFQLGGNFPMYMDKIYPLDDYIASGVVDVSGIGDANLKTTQDTEGHQLGISNGLNSYGIAYDPDMFAEAGVAEPTDTWTWDDYANAANTIHEKLGIYGCSSMLTSEFIAGCSVYVAQYGDVGQYSFFNLDLTGMGFDDPQMLTPYIQMRADSIKNEVYPDAGASAEITNIENDFLVTGEAAMAWVAANQFPTMYNVCQEQGRTLKLATLPRITSDGPSGAVIQSSQMLCVSQDSQQKEEAAKFISWFENDPDCNNILQGERGIPVNATVRETLSANATEGQQIMYDFMLVTMMLPTQVIMIPQYLIYYRLGLVPGYVPLILPYFCGQAFFIYQMMQFMQGIPKDLDEAATIDGCSKYQIYSRIILPLMKPSIVTTVIIQFYWKWDDYMGPLLYLSRPQSYTVSIAIKLFADSASTTDYGAMFAMSTLSLIPVFLIFLFFNRYLVQGIGTSGLKG